jgi:hypothetical protein
MNTTRKLGWLATASLLGAALIAPGATAAATGPEVEPTAVEGNITECPEGQGTTFFFEDSGSETIGDITVELTYNADAKTVDFEVEGGVAWHAFIKGGDGYNHYDYTPLGGVPADDGLVAPDNGSEGPAGLSHAVICVQPVEEESESVPVESEEVSDEPSVSVPVESEEISNEPSGSVQAETGTPEEEVTPPTTDALGATSSPSSDGWQLVLIALAAILATALIVTPASRKARR